MTVHDWTRVTAGVFHSFHNTWIGDLQRTLNEGRLPPDYYALGEQAAGDVGPDVLTLHSAYHPPDSEASGGGEGLIAVADSPPRVRLAQQAAQELAFYLARRRTLVIRHASGDRIVALLEIVSPANKHSRQTIDDFVDKVVAALRDGIHVVLIDLFPPSRHVENGLHGAVWDRLMAGSYKHPQDEPLTLVSYCANSSVTAYVEPLCVGAQLADMPLFLTPEHYVEAPLIATYDAAYRGVPKRWRRVLE